ncbi:FYVE zinc finger-domain-containing protein [Macrophomina phaseolina]|uniref:RING-type E3 ubiquitin transferase n=1 Tax=Macrophomina phaseolina TaxID=35725 RepID=A0ABQ8FVZ5_9PEZI|nr:FYVE zinc finger-domain-containing protein [Macrophomina phaseolina]
MDRPSLPPSSSSASTSVIPRQSSSADASATPPPNPSLLHRGYSDGATASSSALPDRDILLPQHNVDGDTVSRGEGNSGTTGLRQPGDSAMADRKRRLTTPDDPERRGGYRSAAGEGSSQATAIDLTLSPDGSVSSVPRRDSDIVIPQWQPDSDVSHCPVCGTQFSFWYRKHHCRKCGRVVCANCSPHRITIPRQYIVRAPEELRMSRTGLIDLIGEDDGSSSRYDLYLNPALGGGEEVRVCNPCVPDPNLSPPPRHASSAFPNFDSSGFHDQFGQHRYSPLQTPGRSRNMTYDSSQAYGNRQYSHHRQSLSDVSQRSTDPFRSSRVSFQNSTSVSDLFPPPPHPINAGARPNPGGTQPFPQYQSHPSSSFPHFSHHMRPSRSPSTSSTSQHPTRYRTIDTTTPPYPPSMQPQPRQIPEEDECPVCHEELPPKGPDGSTVAREQHVEECIAANFAGPSSQSRTSTPSAAVDAAVAATAAHPGDARASAPTPPVAESSRRRRHTQGMLRYRASEKDCLDETGNPQECIICFEDFKEGDEMGRLECFCKFHRLCIRQWWDTKGDGSCPTHQGGFVLGGS